MTISISKPTTSDYANYGGAAVVGVGAGAVGIKLGSKVGESIAKDVAIAGGAAAGSKISNVHPFVASVIGSNISRTGKAGGFLARFPGLGAHIGNKAGNAATDASINGAAQAIGKLVGHEGAAEAVGGVINAGKHELVSGVAATAVGDGAGKTFSTVAKFGTGALFAAAGAYIAYEAIPNW